MVTKKIRTVTVDLAFFGKDTLIHIASFLATNDLANLGRMCGRFGLTQGSQQRLLANETAQQTFESAATEHEINALPRYDDKTEIARLRQQSLLREPLGFGQRVG